MDRNKGMLRLAKEEDMERLLTWRNRDHVRRNMYNSDIIPYEEHQSWFLKQLENQNTVILIYQYEDIPYGAVIFSNIDRKNSRCYWGFYIGDPSAPRGSGTLMGTLALDYCFKQLQLNKLYGEVLSYNNRSIALHERLGFLREGELKQHIYKEGKFFDVVLFAQYKDRWLDQQKMQTVLQ